MGVAVSFSTFSKSSPEGGSELLGLESLLSASLFGCEPAPCCRCWLPLAVSPSLGSESTICQSSIGTEPLSLPVPSDERDLSSSDLRSCTEVGVMAPGKVYLIDFCSRSSFHCSLVDVLIIRLIVSILLSWQMISFSIDPRSQFVSPRNEQFGISPER